jgi:hypothetical protein
VAGLRQQRRTQRREPALDAGARQPGGRVRDRYDLRPRPRRDGGAGRGGELLERPVRLRPLPEPLPAAGQRRDQLGRQPPTRQQAKVITTRNAIIGTGAAGFVKNGADSVEDAPWSAAINATDAYGYSIFDVDPGAHPGQTTITFQYFAIPAVTNEAGFAHDGTTTLPTHPTEKFVFGRRAGRS